MRGSVAVDSETCNRSELLSVKLCFALGDVQMRKMHRWQICCVKPSLHNYSGKSSSSTTTLGALLLTPTPSGSPAAAQMPYPVQGASNKEGWGQEPQLIVFNVLDSVRGSETAAKPRLSVPILQANPQAGAKWCCGRGVWKPVPARGESLCPSP